jgi:hypothetical protein
LALLPLRSVATAARTCKAWAPAARVVRLRVQLGEALLEPEELIWRRYSGGAGRMVREGFARWAVEVCGCAHLSDGQWAHNVGMCGCSTTEGIDRAGFVQGMYIGLGRDPTADVDKLANQTALQALVTEAAACGAPVRDLREALEARMAGAALMRPLWTASAPQLVDILVGQHGDVDTVKQCCRQLQQRLAFQPANRDAAGDAGCSKALVAALQAHSTDAAVQQWGCAALGTLVANHPANQAAAAAAGGLEAAVAALRAHPGAEDVQEKGCYALGTLARSHPANQAAAAAAGGLEAAVAALWAHPGAEAVQQWGCLALAALVDTHPANQTAAAAAGGLEAVLAALRAHPGAETLQLRGCLALGSLVCDHPANVAAASAAGGAELARAAQQAHPDSANVQTCAKYVLEQLA